MFSLLKHSGLKKTAFRGGCFMSSLRIFVSETFDPHFNLATEEWLFHGNTFSEGSVNHTLFLWRNKPTVVIGRNQNPWKECRLDEMEKLGVVLARRPSGGGAVFHDVGNTNFTFLSARNDFSIAKNMKIITDSLQSFGLAAEVSGRNDITVEGKKVSGSAFRHTPTRAMHHGTLLIDVDMTVLAGLLSPNKAKLQSKGVQSVASRVANLKQLCPTLTHNTLSGAIVDAFTTAYSATADPPKVEVLSTETLQKIPELSGFFERQKDWNWRFGNTPKFSHNMETRFDWGVMDVHLDAHKGKITKSVIFSDCLLPDLVDTLALALEGVEYSPDAVGRTFSALPCAADESTCHYVHEFSTWLQHQIRSSA
eukprot:GCRY01000929.1.p1 GENE.GCRY01000929.1~~GCRY01000929.1.p1  ORF type:complete len:366 (+),score=103.16 GCRY01000929.1:166-1263(+)